MSRARSFAKYWLPVAIWMVVIFSASSDEMSAQRTSRFLAPMIRWFFPSLNDETVGEIVFGIRKCAHMTEYAVLAVLIWRGRRKPFRNDPRPWQWSDVKISLLFATLYAASDEFHQLFVPTRQSSVWDVLIDASGAIGGLLLVWSIGKVFKKW